MAVRGARGGHLPLKRDRPPGRSLVIPDSPQGVLGIPPAWRRVVEAGPLGICREDRQNCSPYLGFRRAPRAGIFNLLIKV